PWTGIASRSAPVPAFTCAYVMNCPSGDQLLATAKVLLFTSNSGARDPFAGLWKIPPGLVYATNWPSDDQIGFWPHEGGNVSCVAAPLARSSTDIWEFTSSASRCPSGESIATPPASPNAPRFVP